MTAPPAWLEVGEAVEAMSWRPGGDMVAIGDLGGGLTVAFDGLERAHRLDPHPGGTTAVAWHPVLDLIASGGLDGVLRIQAPTPGSATAIDVGSAVSALAWSPGGELLAVGGGSSVGIVEPGGTVVAWYSMLPGTVHAVAWADGPAPLAAAVAGGVVWLQVSNDTGAAPEIWEVTGAARALACDPGRRRLAVGDFAGVLRVISLASSDQLTLDGWDERIDLLAWDGSGRRLAVPDSASVVVCVLEGIDPVGEEPIVLEGHEVAVSAVQYSGSELVTGGADGLVIRWPVERLHDPDVVDVGAPVTALGVAPTRKGPVLAGTRQGTVHRC